VKSGSFQLHPLHKRVYILTNDSLEHSIKIILRKTALLRYLFNGQTFIQVLIDKIDRLIYAQNTIVVQTSIPPVIKGLANCFIAETLHFSPNTPFIMELVVSFTFKIINPVKSTNFLQDLSIEIYLPAVYAK